MGPWSLSDRKLQERFDPVAVLAIHHIWSGVLRMAGSHYQQVANIHHCQIGTDDGWRIFRKKGHHLILYLQKPLCHRQPYSCRGEAFAE
ncbi:hypothetical protein D3C73_960690 [compost metagenome]